mmetsp:Transcript_96838/g.250558  ORF Transcript_96838/g.250558 Transcript_96838/m.250558 type:complete len:247 (-) Transcript_96838:1032-1772(-)
MDFRVTGQVLPLNFVAHYANPDSSRFVPLYSKCLLGGRQVLQVERLGWRQCPSKCLYATEWSPSIFIACSDLEAIVPIGHPRESWESGPRLHGEGNLSDVKWPVIDFAGPCVQCRRCASSDEPTMDHGPCIIILSNAELILKYGQAFRHRPLKLQQGLVCIDEGDSLVHKHRTLACSDGRRLGHLVAIVPLADAHSEGVAHSWAQAALRECEHRRITRVHQSPRIRTLSHLHLIAQNHGAVRTARE